MASTQTSTTDNENPMVIQQGKQGWNSVNVDTIERLTCTLGGGSLAVIGLLGDIRHGRPSFPGVALGLIGGWLTYRGVSGHCFIYQALDIDTTQKNLSGETIRFEKAMTVNCSPEDLYLFWQDKDATNKEELPKTTAQGTIDISEQRRKELDAWNKLKKTVTAHSGYIHFDKAPNGRGTEVRVIITYTPPLGKVGEITEKLLGKSPEQQVTEDLRLFKEILEAGEAPSTQGQPTGQ